MKELQKILGLLFILIIFIGSVKGAVGSEWKAAKPVQETQRDLLSPQRKDAEDAPPALRRLEPQDIERAADIKKLKAAGFSDAEANAIAFKKPEARGITADEAIASKKVEDDLTKAGFKPTTNEIAEYAQHAKRLRDAGIEESVITKMILDQAKAKKTKESETTPKDQGNQGLLSKFKSAIQSFITKKETPVISKPTEEAVETPKKKEAEEFQREAARLGAIDISDPSKFKTKIKELGRSITTALTKLKTKLTPENMSSIKQQVNEFARQVIGAKENQTLRAALSEQLESVRKGLDKAIAAIPVNSPQRRTMLDARGTNNWARVQLAQAELRDNPKSVVAQAEYTRALDIMLRNPASTNLLRRSLDDAIKEKESAMYQEQDATKKRALAEELNGLMQKRTALQNIGKNKLRVAAAANVLIEDTTKKLSELEAEKNKLAEQKTKLLQLQVSANPPQDIVEQIRKVNASIDQNAKQLEETSASLDQAKKLLETPATRLQKAKTAIKKATQEIQASVNKFKLPTQKEIAEAVKKAPGIKKVISGISNLIDRIKTSAAKVDTKTIGQHLSKLKESAKKLKTEIEKLGESALKRFDKLSQDFDRFIADVSKSNKVADSSKKDVEEATAERKIDDDEKKEAPLYPVLERTEAPLSAETERYIAEGARLREEAAKQTSAKPLPSTIATLKTDEAVEKVLVSYQQKLDSFRTKSNEEIETEAKRLSAQYTSEEAAFYNRYPDETKLTETEKKQMEREQKALNALGAHIQALRSLKQ